MGNWTNGRGISLLSPYPGVGHFGGVHINFQASFLNEPISSLTGESGVWF